MTHIEQRLAQRNIYLSHSEIVAIASRFVCAAIILAKGTHKGDTQPDYYSRLESNGDLVVLIVRDHYPVTVMYRRSNQTNTPCALRVDEVIDYSERIKQDD